VATMCECMTGEKKDTEGRDLVWGGEIHTQQKYLQRTSEIVNQQYGNEKIKNGIKSI